MSYFNHRGRGGVTPIPGSHYTPEPEHQVEVWEGPDGHLWAEEQRSPPLSRASVMQLELWLSANGYRCAQVLVDGESILLSRHPGLKIDLPPGSSQ